MTAAVRTPTACRRPRSANRSPCSAGTCRCPTSGSTATTSSSTSTHHRPRPMRRMPTRQTSGSACTARWRIHWRPTRSGAAATSPTWRFSPRPRRRPTSCPARGASARCGTSPRYGAPTCTRRRTGWPAPPSTTAPPIRSEYRRPTRTTRASRSARRASTRSMPTAHRSMSARWATRRRSTARDICCWASKSPVWQRDTATSRPPAAVRRWCWLPRRCPPPACPTRATSTAHRCWCCRTPRATPSRCARPCARRARWRLQRSTRRCHSSARTPACGPPMTEAGPTEWEAGPGVGPWRGPLPTDARDDQALLRDGDTRNVVDAYRYWTREAIVADIDTRRHRLHVAIENFGNDANIGSGVRTPHAFAVDTVHIVGRRRWNRRGAMVTDRYQRLRHHDTTADLLAFAADGGLTVVAVDNVPGAQRLEETGLPAACLLVFGQEGPGITDDALAGAELTLSIAQFGSTRSINAGVAAGIVMHTWIVRHADLGLAW